MAPGNPVEALEGGKRLTTRENQPNKFNPYIKDLRYQDLRSWYPVMREGPSCINAATLLEELLKIIHLQCNAHCTGAVL